MAVHGLFYNVVMSNVATCDEGNFKVCHPRCVCN